jgi:hypothetical protein
MNANIIRKEGGRAMQAATKRFSRSLRSLPHHQVLEEFMGTFVSINVDTKI